MYFPRGSSLKNSFFLMLVSTSLSCKKKDSKVVFSEDLELLNAIEEIDVLNSGKLQGCVFTSSSKGFDGLSYGWLRCEFSEEIVIVYSKGCCMGLG